MFWVLIFTVHLILRSSHVTYAFKSESTLYSCLNVKEAFARSNCEIWRLSDSNWTRNKDHLILNRTLNYLAKLAKWLSCVVNIYQYGALDFMFLPYHVHVSEKIPTLQLLNVKELLARSRGEIWRLSDWNWTRTWNDLVSKRTLNSLVKVIKWLSCILSTYVYSAFDCMFFSFNVRVSEWIHTL